MSELSNGAFNSYLREKKQEEDIAATGGGGGVPGLFDVLDENNIMGGLALRLENDNETYLKNSEGRSQVESDDNGGLQVRDADGLISANFNSRKLIDDSETVILDWSNGHHLKFIISEYADDAAAIAAGVPNFGIYHTAGVLKIVQQP